jgi:hypothetical protein
VRCATALTCSRRCPEFGPRRGHDNKPITPSRRPERLTQRPSDQQTTKAGAERRYYDAIRGNPVALNNAGCKWLATLASDNGRARGAHCAHCTGLQQRNLTDRWTIRTERTSIRVLARAQDQAACCRCLPVHESWPAPSAQFASARGHSVHHGTTAGPCRRRRSSRAIAWLSCVEVRRSSAFGARLMSGTSRNPVGTARLWRTEQA